MSYSEFPSGASFHYQSRWFNGGPARLLRLLTTAAALIAGMFLGRFLTQSEMQRTVTRLEAELTDNDAEIGMLRRQQMQPPPQQRELEQLNEEHGRLLARLTEIEKNLAIRQELIEQAIDRTKVDQRACLAELGQFRQRGRSLSADDVVRFAEWMFQARSDFLESLKSGQPASPTAEQAAPFPVIRDPDIDAENAEGFVRSGHRPDGSTPIDARRTSAQVTGRFFSPPKRRTGYTFVAPRRSSRVAAGPSGIRFSDQADDQQGPVLR